MRDGPEILACRVGMEFMYSVVWLWNGILYMRDGAESHACLVGMESMYSLDYLHRMESLTCVMELKVSHAKRNGVNVFT
jgi:hypothetical protein